LHGADAELLQVRNLLDQTGVGAALVLGDTGTRMARETADVHFVDDRARRWPVKRRVALPVVRGRVDDDAFHRRRCIIARAAGGLTAIALRHNDAATVRI